MKPKSKDYIKISCWFWKHLKTLRLKRKLGSEGVIALIRLWCYAGIYKPDGRLERWDEEDIEMAAEWQGEPGVFVRTLRELGWLDADEETKTYSLHGWQEHQGE